MTISGIQNLNGPGYYAAGLNEGPSFGQAPVNYTQAPDSFERKDKGSVLGTAVKLGGLALIVGSFIVTKGRLKGTKILSKEFFKSFLKNLNPLRWSKGAIAKIAHKNAGNEVKKARDVLSTLENAGKKGTEEYTAAVTKFKDAQINALKLAKKAHAVDARTALNKIKKLEIAGQKGSEEYTQQLAKYNVSKSKIKTIIGKLKPKNGSTVTPSNKKSAENVMEIATDPKNNLNRTALAKINDILNKPANLRSTKEIAYLEKFNK